MIIKQAEGAIVRAGRRGNRRQRTRRIDQRIHILAQGAVGGISALDAIGTAGRAAEDGGIEIVIIGAALVADGVVVAVVAAQLAGLACQPREGDIEGAKRTFGVAVALVIVILALLNATRVGTVPPQAADHRIVVTAHLPEQLVTSIEEHAAVVDERVGIHAGNAVVVTLGADITASVAGEAEFVDRVVVGLWAAGAEIGGVLEVVGSGAVEGVVLLHVGGAVAVDRAEAYRGAAGQASEAVRGTRAGLAPAYRLCAVFALRRARIIEPRNADAPTCGEHAIPTLHARPALRGKRPHALIAGIGARLHGGRRGLIVKG